MQVQIPPANLGFQVGEALQVRNGGASHGCGDSSRGDATSVAWHPAPAWASAHTGSAAFHPILTVCSLLAQIHSGGLLRGTPHCVFAPRPELSGGISRETFAGATEPSVRRMYCRIGHALQPSSPFLSQPPACAVFMQPHWDCPLEPPAGVSPADVGIGQWQPGLSFGETSELTMDACG